MPFFSIIIPTFNSAATLSGTIESILCQERADFDIWVIDGQSTDATPDVLESYRQRDKRVHFISEPDKGIYDAMNKGMALAEGEWLNFMGSDDQFYGTAVLPAIAREAHTTDASVLYGNVLIKGDTSWAKDGEVYDGAFDLEKLTTRNICHQAIFYKRSFLQQQVGAYNIDYRLCADWDFNLRCFAKGRFQYIDTIVAAFNAGGESTRNNRDLALEKDFVANLSAYFNVSVFDSLLDNPNRWWYAEIVRLQKKQNFLRFFMKKVTRKLKNNAPA